MDLHDQAHPKVLVWKKIHLYEDEKSKYPLRAQNMNQNQTKGTRRHVRHFFEFSNTGIRIFDHDLVQIINVFKDFEAIYVLKEHSSVLKSILG